MLPPTHNISFNFTIIDLSQENPFHFKEEPCKTVICINSTKETVQKVIEILKPETLLAFSNEASFLEYHYLEIAQITYGAFLDFDTSEILRIFKAYRQNESTSFGIIHCVDLNHLEKIPINKEIFFANIFPNPEEAHPILITDKFHKVLEMFAPTSSGTIIFAPYHKQSEKLFWSE